ncbi:hypothetical protein L198_05167 [Cryptococcus wingfieldii CBS 7118]|uniref:C2H2-type domain-containing protein n=1 Tax=Cryptococcus wingfieldii CBS 7118 TaxID=1295528 RepID=A0A1E3J2X6_9TREE|nr:hypothetical protein L198_05167 [Cryptococcus wingfieldii CBS 7118]ODN94311.1 hypothetical protein L198_05167 [Cryptococcus wingfieldii CBS 7118]
MGDPSTPSFDSIFAQAPRRNDSTNSTNSFSHYTADAPFFPSRQQVSDEPQDLPENFHEPSASTSRDHSREDTESGHPEMRSGGYNVNGKRRESLRKESLPFNPETDSTLIATASKRDEGAAFSNGYSSPPIGDIMFGPQQSLHNPHQQAEQQQPQSWAMGGGLSRQSLSYGAIQQQHFSPFQSPQPTPSTAGIDFMRPPSTASSMGDSVMSDQLGAYLNHRASMEDIHGTQRQQVQGEWGQDFLGDEQGLYGQQQVDDVKQGHADGHNEENGAGLQRIISNHSHHSSYPSRTSSPYPQQQFAPPETAPTPLNSHSRTGSLSASRSPSPLAPSQTPDVPMNVMSPPLANQHPSYPRASSSPHSNPNSPFFNKPQSPPALIIPNATASPALPPLVTGPQVTGTQTYTGHGLGHPQIRQGVSSGSGGLFPPVNPALEHLGGMAGISPIAPNADGPMIRIQPSTPISGLKEGRGLFDAALRIAKANQQAQAQKGQYSGDGKDTQSQDFHASSSQTQTLSNSSSAEQVAGREGEGAGSQRIDFAATMGQYGQHGWLSAAGGRDNLRVAGQTRPRAKSDSIVPSPTADSFDRQAFLSFIGANDVAAPALQQNVEIQQDQGMSSDAAEQWRNSVTAWKMGVAGNEGGQSGATLDPRLLPGQDDTDAIYQQLLIQQQTGQPPQLDQSQQHQLRELQAQRERLYPLNTNPPPVKPSSGEISPTSLVFYQSLGLYPHNAPHLSGTVSAPWTQTTFGNVTSGYTHPATAGPSQQYFLAPGLPKGRRSSFGGGEHPAVGAGTPGYGVEFSPQLNARPGPVRGSSMHKRWAKSEDFGRGGTGWGVGTGGSTAEFLQSITGDDGSLLPPTSRGRSMSHSRHSSASSVRSASPALSISSQGSSFSHHSPRMEMMDGMQLPGYAGYQPSLQVPQLYEDNHPKKMKVTSAATKVASETRRTQDGLFMCPVPGCGSTFTRHFNLKGHLRSHNDERPYKCLYEGCPKATIGFARQHDCKRHMLLHEGLRLFECDACGKKFARLDALTRHHKSEQGQECAISHPLPCNPDGSAMSESQYKSYKGIQTTPEENERRPSASGTRRRRSGTGRSHVSAEEETPATE